MSDATLLIFNKSEEVVDLDIRALCVETEDNDLSPIDEYFVHSRKLLIRASSVVSPEDDILLGLLLLELVSSAELYFRKVLASLPGVCPLSMARASKSTLMMGAMAYYTPNWLPLGLLEHMSLSGKGEVRKATSAITGLDIPDNCSAGVALADYERICQLRHAVIHARGHLWFRNVAELGLPASTSLRLCLSVLGYQVIVAKTHNAVRAYNALVANRILGAWIGKKILTGRWRVDRQRFTRFHRLFASREDAVGDLDVRVAYRKVQPLLRAS